ncbi:MAG: MerR family DNA-binding transcriptional regulator, partial [Nitrospirota bacterium]
MSPPVAYIPFPFIVGFLLPNTYNKTCSHYRCKCFFKRSNSMLIGTFSERTDCHIETIRYYERMKLLPKPP